MISGSVDHRLTAVLDNGNQEQFTGIFRFLNGPLRSGSFVELVALQTGSGGTGTDYYDEPTPFGNNAFAVWKFPSGTIAGTTSKRASDMYVLMQWADTTAFGSSPGDPGVLDNSTGDGVGFAVAWRDDGGSPWNGTTLANGDDSKGTPVWSSSVGGLHVLPRANSFGGNRATNRENCVLLNDQVTNPTRYQCLADRDNLFIIVDVTDNADYDRVLHIGCYEPLPGLSGAIDNPIFMLRETALPWADGASFGLTTAGAADDGGIWSSGVTAPYETRIMRILRGCPSAFNTNDQPNPQYVTGSAYDAFNMYIAVYETDYGIAGRIDFWSETYNAAVNDILPDGTGAILGDATLGVLVPWASGTLAPGSTSTREGRFI